jgi:hypothetical protein
MPYFGIPIRNGLPIGLGSVAGFGVAPAFSPSVLFTAGEQGAWYDPSDLTTLFQDASGTTPTTMETRVRLMLDKSKGLVLGPELVVNGDFSSSANWTLAAGGGGSATIANGLLTLSGGAAAFPNATQSGILTSGRWYRVTVVTTSAVTSNSLGLRVGGLSTQFSGFTAAGTYTRTIQADGTDLRLIRNSGFTDTADVDSISVQELPGNHATAPSDASSPILRARYNLLTYSEEFNNGAWTKSGCTVSANAGVAPNGTTTADKYIVNNGSAFGAGVPVYQQVTLGATNITIAVYAKADGITSFVLQDASGNGGTFNLSAGTAAVAGGGVPTITNVGSGWYLCKVTIASGPANPYAYMYASGAGTGDGVAGILFWGADLRTSVDAALNIPAYQSITTATSYDTNGFPPYLAFDGTDDSFSTASIDFTGTPQMTVFAGTTRLSDAAGGILAELSANFNSNAGTFLVSMPDGANTKVAAALSQGNGIDYNTGEYTDAAAPSTAINAVYFDKSVSTDEVAFIRKNGVAQTLVRAFNANTTGNFGNYPLFIGRRNNTSGPLNGRIYSLIIRGAATTTPLIASTEQWVAGKMRLPI